MSAATKVIEVRLNAKDMPLDDGPRIYLDWLESKLKEAGIPVDGNKLLRGKLTRLDDPKDFRIVIYIWEP